MHASLFTSPEPLESRIAPAGLITTSFANGVLTISGTDGADHDVEIIKTGTYTFRVEGNDTGINAVGVTSKNFRGTLNSVNIEGGAGADTFALTNLGVLKSMRFNGNDGVDSLTTTNLRTVLGGKVQVDLGAEGGTATFGGTLSSFGGILAVNFGGGGTVNFGSTTTTVSGSATFTGGSGSDLVAITGDVTTFKQKLTFNGSDGDDAFTGIGTSLTVRGLVAMDGGAGTNNFVFAANKNIFGTSLVAGSMDLKLGVGPGTVMFLGDSTSILGNLKIDLGTSGGSAHLSSAVTTVRDHVLMTGGAGNDTVAFDGRTTLGRTLTFSGGVGDDVLSATGGLLLVKGATVMEGGAGNSRFDLNVTSLALTTVNVTGGDEKDVVSIVADGTISGNASFLLGIDGTGISSTVLKSKAGLVDGLKFGGLLTVDMVGVTVDALTIANLQVAKNVVIQTGEGVSTVDISKLNARSNFQLKTGDGADVVNIDNIKTQAFTVDTGIGADDLNIERNALYTGTSQVLGIATILTGIGADQIRIGNIIDAANTKVLFIGAMSLDAGDGANISNNLLTSNFFVTAPSLVSTGGVLDQSAA